MNMNNSSCSSRTTPSSMFDFFEIPSYECSDVSDLVFDAKALFLRFRLTIAMIILTALNIVSHHIKTTYIRKFEAYQHLTPEASEQLACRCMQFLFGVLIAGSGYGTLAINYLTGCNTNEIFIYFLGGTWMNCFDIHEYISRWPLPPALLAHHSFVILLGLAMVDWQVIPANPHEHLDSRMVLMISNIGATWVSDFFHAVYRTSFSLKLIHSFQWLFLASSVVRMSNFYLLVEMAKGSANGGSSLGAAMLLLLAVAYGYNSIRAVCFVYNFDCNKYFAEHQAKWHRTKAL